MPPRPCATRHRGGARQGRHRHRDAPAPRPPGRGPVRQRPHQAPPDDRPRRHGGLSGAQLYVLPAVCRWERVTPSASERLQQPALGGRAVVTGLVLVLLHLTGADAASRSGTTSWWSAAPAWPPPWALAGRAPARSSRSSRSASACRPRRTSCGRAMCRCAGFEPDVSVADIAWFGSYVAIGAALFLLLRGRGARRLDLDGVIDIAAITVVALLIQWNLILKDIVTDTRVAVVPRIVWALYPALDAVLLALVLRAVTARRLRGSLACSSPAGPSAGCCRTSSTRCRRRLGRRHRLARRGLDRRRRPVGRRGLVVAADSPDPTAADRTEHVGLRRAGHRPPAPPPPRRPRGGRRLRGDHPNPVPLFIASVVLVGIAFVRTARSLRAEADVRAALLSQERRPSRRHQLLRRGRRAHADGRVIGEAPQLAALVGHAEPTPVGRCLLDLVEPMDVDDARAMFRRCLAMPGQTFETELRVHHADGRRWLGVRPGQPARRPRRRRRRRQPPRRHRPQAGRGGARPPGVPRRADRPGQPRPVPRPGRAGPAPQRPHRPRPGGHLPRPRRLQDGQRQPRPRRRRRAAPRGGRSGWPAAVRAGDTVARLGGDEFAILIEQSRRPVDEARVDGRADPGRARRRRRRSTSRP